MVDLKKAVGENTSEKGEDLVIYDFDGNELFTLKVRSYQSATVQRVLRANAKLFEKMKARGVTPNADDELKAQAKVLQALIAGGDKFKIDGEEIDPAKLTLEQAKLISKEYSAIIATPVSNFADEPSNFYEKVKGN